MQDKKCQPIIRKVTVEYTGTTEDFMEFILGILKEKVGQHNHEFMHNLPLLYRSKASGS